MATLARFVLGPDLVIYLANLAIVVSLICSIGLLAVWACRRCSTPLRHGILISVLALTLLCPASIWLGQRKGLALIRVALPLQDTAGESGMSSMLVLPHGSPSGSRVFPSRPRNGGQATTSPLQSPGVDLSRRPEADMPAVGDASSDASAKAHGRSSLPVSYEGTQSLWWEVLGTLAAFVWTVGILVGLLRLGLGYVALKRIRPSFRAVDPRVTGLGRRAGADIGLREIPPLYICPLVPVPVSLGLRRPAIVLPAEIVRRMDDAQLEAILVHETAHIVRRDPWVGLAQRMAVVVFWWNPLVRRVSDQISELREDLCDNYVVRAQGDGEQFARTLVDVASRITAHPVLPATVGVLEPKLDGLAERIHRLTDKERNMAIRMNIGSMVLVLTCGLTILVGTGLLRCLRAAEATPTAPTEKAGAKSTTTLGGIDAVVEPKTGFKFTLAKTFEGENDQISVIDRLMLSPNGRFLHWWGMVVPLDGAAPFTLLDQPVQYECYSPGGNWIAFIGNDGLYVVPITANNGKPSGPPTKLSTTIPNIGQGHPLAWSRDSRHVVFKDSEQIMRALSVPEGVVSEWSGSLGILSPDGNTLAFSAGGEGMWVQPVSGGPARNLSSLGSFSLCEPVAWSADGQWIIGQASGGWDPNERRLGIHELRFVHTTSTRQYIVPVPEDVGTFVGKAAASRDLYFYRPSYEVQNVPKIASPASGQSEPITLARPPGALSDYQWSPDSATLIAITYSIEDQQLRCWLLPVSGGAPRELKLEVPELTWVYPRSFDRDGGQVLLTAQGSDGEHACFVAPVSLEQGKIIGPVHRLCPAVSPSPIWTPDGSRLAVVKDGHLWLVSPDGREWSELPGKTESISSPSWSPDGSHIAFMTFPETGATLHMMPARGGESRILYTWPGKEHKWDWAANGRSVTVIADGVLHNVSTVEGQTTELLNLKKLGYTGVDWMGWSPDGQWFAFYAVGSDKERDELFVMTAQDRTPRKIATQDRWPTRWIFGWSPDSRHIAYTYEDRVRRRPVGVLYRFDADEALKTIATGAIAMTPVAESKPAESKAATHMEPITGPVFTDDFDKGPSKYWRFQDFPDQGLISEHAIENGHLLLSGARAYLDGLDWTDYTVTVRVSMEEAVAFGEGVFGIVARTTPSKVVDGRMDQYSLYFACTNNTPVSILLHMNYTDNSNTLRHDRLSRSPCSIVRDKWYTLKLEVRGQHLRGYLDDKLMVEATDTRLPKGGIWLNTYRSRVLFDDFSVRQLP